MNTRHENLERAGCPLHYWVHGSNSTAPTLVFTHGAGADHHMFDDQLGALVEQYRVLTWDVRGHGLSRPMGAGFSIHRVVDDLIAILDHEGINEAIFCGQSMGGNTSQEVVHRYPERVIGLVLIDCVCNTFPLSAFERWAVSITPALLRWYPLGMLLKQSAKVSARLPEVQTYLYNTMKKLTKDEIVTVLTETTLILRDDPEYRIPCPFVLVRGEHDNAGAIKKQALGWSQREPNCQQYIVIPDAGHCANQDNPQAFNQQLIELLPRLLRHGVQYMGG